MKAAVAHIARDDTEANRMGCLGMGSMCLIPTTPRAPRMLRPYTKLADRTPITADESLPLSFASRFTRTLLASLLLPLPALSQHEHPAAPSDPVDHSMHGMIAGALGISHARMGSGTTWVPDVTPMRAIHATWGDWSVMLHGVAFLQYDRQYSRRGDTQLGLIDWEMLMLMRRVGPGLLHLHAMTSLEPLTIGAEGYPLLLQTGETFEGRPLVDRQHPHDLIMELAGMYEQPVSDNLAVSLYAGLAGEPAMGPVAFMHRPSAQSDPLAPLGHHWQDATHITFGVVTAGIFSRYWKLEGSWFNGREPDENRWNLDLRPLDSWAGRLTLNPTPRVSLAGWYGFLETPEASDPDESTRRYGASLLFAHPGVGGGWSSMLLWGANDHGHGAEPSFVAESDLQVRGHSVFARYEFVRKSADDLVVESAGEADFPIHSFVAGYARDLVRTKSAAIGAGFRASVNWIPASLAESYGTRRPAGIAVYLRIRPPDVMLAP